MPFLRAPTAKRAVGTGVIGDEIDLNDVDTSGMYRVQKPKNGAYDYGQLLVIHGYGDTIAQYAVHADSTETLPSGRTGHPSHFVLIPKCMNYRLQMA